MDLKNLACYIVSDSGSPGLARSLSKIGIAASRVAPLRSIWHQVAQIARDDKS